jgi:hypothetical protein
MDDSEILDWLDHNALEVQYIVEYSSDNTLPGCTVTYLDNKGSIRYASGLNIRAAVVTAVEQSE